MTERDVVTVRGLRKTYGARVVVDGLDLDVRAGEIVGLIGANGAGKTTTVECIQGLRRPDAGVLRVLGYDPVTQAERLRPLVGSQLQDSALPDRLRVAEALDLFATSPGPRRRRAAGAVRAGRAPPLGVLLAERRRAAAAVPRARAAQPPRLVILDELTQGLDPAARRDVWAAVRQLHEAGTTVLLVTHEMDEAEALCDRVVVMRAGRVLDAGTPAELVDRHAPQGDGPVQPAGPARAAAGRAPPARRRARGGAGRRAGHRARRPAHHRARRRGAGAVGTGARRPRRPRSRSRGRPAQPARAEPAVGGSRFRQRSELVGGRR